MRGPSQRARRRRAKKLNARSSRLLMFEFRHYLADRDVGPMFAALAVGLQSRECPLLWDSAPQLIQVRDELPEEQGEGRRDVGLS